MKKGAKISIDKLDQFANDQRQFRRDYHTNGLISYTADEGVHLKYDAFIATFPEYLEEAFAEDDDNTLLLKAEHRKVIFFCLKHIEKAAEEMTEAEKLLTKPRQINQKAMTREEQEIYLDEHPDLVKQHFDEMETRMGKPGLFFRDYKKNGGLIDNLVADVRRMEMTRWKEHRQGKGK